jgi:hypothetical protein
MTLRQQEFSLQIPDWPAWTRRVEKNRRELNGAATRPPQEFHIRHTLASFAMEGLIIGEAELRTATARGAGARQFRSRQCQRARNHIAILKHIDLTLLRRKPVRPTDVIRWYTSISCGLSMSTLTEATIRRLEQTMSRTSAPPLRLRSALEEAAQVHALLMAEPIVPSFNGILARLVLRYHLGRCGLPPIVFDPAIDDTARCADESRLLTRLMQLIDVSFCRTV